MDWTDQVLKISWGGRKQLSIQDSNNKQFILSARCAACEAPLIKRSYSIPEEQYELLRKHINGFNEMKHYCQECEPRGQEND